MSSILEHSDNNNRSSAIRRLSRRVLLIIASTRRRFSRPNIANDTGLAQQFCDTGLFCCAFSEHELSEQYVDNIRMEGYLLNANTGTGFAYADDIHIN